MTKKLLYIGNKLSGQGNTVTSIETLGGFLESEGVVIYYASSKKNKIIRMLDMFFKTIKYSVVAVAATAAPANDNVFTFRSPMIGTFYRKPGADKDAFVKVGDSVKNGDVLCIVEAMKLFNEIEFDGGAGKIVKILVDDASPVEYDQPLFLIEKA